MAATQYVDPLAGLNLDDLGDLETKTCPVCASQYAGTPMLDAEELMRRDVELQKFIKTLEDAANRGSALVEPKSAAFIAKCLRNIYTHTQKDGT